MKRTSEEMYNERLGRVVGSAVGAILGLDPTRTRADVLNDMLDAKKGFPRSFSCSISDYWELMFQYEALVQFMSETGRAAWQASFCVHDNFNWLGANPDAFVDDDDSILIIRAPYELRDERSPEFMPIAQQPLYFIQAQVQMYVTSRVSCYFWQWAPFGRKLELVEYDPNCIAETIPSLEDFHKEYIQLCG